MSLFLIIIFCVVLSGCFSDDYYESVGLEFNLLPDGTYEVSGSGKCYDPYVYIPKKYKGKDVTKIGKSAFSRCLSIRGLFIPENIIEISDFAFNSCERLEEVIISDGVTRIGKNAFYFCKMLETVEIPERATLPSLHPQNNCCTL